MNQSTLALPIQQQKGDMNYAHYESHLPPTPYSSSSSTHSNGLCIKKYGSLDKSDQLERFLPATPSQTTISPNDDDEGLYLLWTQQLLRERGFTPSSCKPQDESDDDNSSVSSINSDNSLLDLPYTSDVIYPPSISIDASHVTEMEDVEQPNHFFTCISSYFKACF